MIIFPHSCQTGWHAFKKKISSLSLSLPFCIHTPAHCIATQKGTPISNPRFSLSDTTVGEVEDMSGRVGSKTLSNVASNK